MLSTEKGATLEVGDPKATKPLKKQGMMELIRRQFSSAGGPPLTGEEVLSPKLHGQGNYHWYPLAWTRWLVRWENFKTLLLALILLGLMGIKLVISNRKSYEVNLPVPATELLLKARGFDSFSQRQVESFIIFLVNAANQSSSEGMPNLNLLEGSLDPAIYLRIQQRDRPQKQSNLAPADCPIKTLYLTETTRWRYNPANRLIMAYVKGFRMSNTISGKSGMEKYRAALEIFWEPSSNRNRWGFYVQKLDEFYGPAADASDAELKNRDRSGF